MNIYQLIYTNLKNYKMIELLCSSFSKQSLQTEDACVNIKENGFKMLQYLLAWKCALCIDNNIRVKNDFCFRGPKFDPFRDLLNVFIILASKPENGKKNKFVQLSFDF